MNAGRSPHMTATPLVSEHRSGRKPFDFHYLPSSAIFQPMDETLNDPAEALLRTYSAVWRHQLSRCRSHPALAAGDRCMLAANCSAFFSPDFMASRSCIRAICPTSPAAAFARSAPALHPEMCKSLARREATTARSNPTPIVFWRDFFSKLAECARDALDRHRRRLRRRPGRDQF